MSEKRRGLGRGLGALIPTVAAGDRPVDVFFPNEPRPTGTRGAAGAKDALVPSGPAPSTPESSRPDGRDARGGADSASSRAERLDRPVRGADVGGSSGGPGSGTDEGESSIRRTSTSAERDQAGAAGDESGRAQGRSVGRSAAMSDVLKPLTSRSAATGASRTGSRSDSGASAVDPSAPREITSVSRETYAAAVGDLGQNELVPVPGATFAEIQIDTIRPNSRQPRTVFDENDLAELVGSIREIGVLQPIVVRPEPDGTGYELIMGERRWRASRAAGLTVIPAIIRETDDSDLLRDALLENLHRSALNPLEEAAAYRQLLDDFGCTHEELASRLSRSRPQISNTLRLLRLPPLVQRRVAAGVLSAGHARALLGLTDGSEIERLAQRIVAEGLSVRATEEIVSLGGRADDEKRVVRRPRRGGRVQAIDELAGRLSDRFETRVKVDLGKSKGKLTVEFASVEDLNRILAVMAPEEQGLFKKP